MTEDGISNMVPSLLRILNIHYYEKLITYI